MKRNLVGMKKVKLPEPLPQSYPAIRKFIKENRDDIYVTVLHTDSGCGVRYLVDQNDVDRVCNEKLGL